MKLYVHTRIYICPATHYSSILAKFTISLQYSVYETITPTQNSRRLPCAFHREKHKRENQFTNDDSQINAKTTKQPINIVIADFII